MWFVFEMPVTIEMQLKYFEKPFKSNENECCLLDKKTLCI